MADKTIGELTQATSLNDNDLFVLEQNGEAKKMPMALILDRIMRLGYITFDEEEES